MPFLPDKKHSVQRSKIRQMTAPTWSITRCDHPEGALALETSAAKMIKRKTDLP